MLIDNLKIKGFRGISDSVELDLTAPLTVIYAPNGTGKTSICDGVEWLLCGAISRLFSLEKGDVRSRFANPDIETSVEATFPKLEQSLSIRRSLNNSGSQLFWASQNEDYRKATDLELLRLIVTALPPTNSPKSKVDWVRSTRFLESDSLNLLIDSDPESNDTRKLIFSNLFGVSEYQKSENSLNRILRKLPANRTIENELKKLEAKISDYGEILKKNSDQKVQPYVDNALNLLKSIANHIDEKISEYESLSVQEFYQKLEIRFIEKKQTHEDNKIDLESVTDALSYYLKAKDDLEKVLEETNSIKEKLDRDNESVDKNEKHLESSRKNISEKNSLVESLDRALAELDIENRSYEQVFHIYQNSDFGVPKTGDYKATINEFIFKEKENLRKSSDKRDLVVEAIAFVPDWFSKTEDLEAIKERIKALEVQIIDHKGEADLAKQLSDTRISLDKLQSERKKTFDEMELLIASGKRYLENNKDQTECPLCMHDFKDSGLLLSNIDRRFMQLSNASKEEASLSLRVEELTKQLERESSLLRQLNEHKDHQIELAEKVEGFREIFIALGFDDAILKESASEMDDKLREEKEELNKRIEIVTKKISTADQVLDAIQELERVLAFVQSRSEYWDHHLQEYRSENFTIDELGARIVLLKGHLSDYKNKITNEKDEAALSSTKTSQELNEVTKMRDEKIVKLSDKENKSEKLKAFIRKIDGKWSKISDSNSLSESGIKALDAKLTVKTRIYIQVEGLFEQVAEYLDKIKNVKLLESENELISAEIELANKEVKEWENQKHARKVAEDQIKLLQEEVNRFVSKEIVPLSNAISTLYLRAQGNRFISSIEAEPTSEGLLNWIAKLDEHGEAFDKMQALSQGQRQDLALSIFLARARSLGGTFFLDEPLVHLDDLNKVALLDTLRVIVSENSETDKVRLVLTTASNNLVKHLREKFALADVKKGKAPLRIYKMFGNPKIGLEIPEPENVYCPNKFTARHQ